jgi:pyruvate-formate lyase-activating enzyme
MRRLRELARARRRFPVTAWVRQSLQFPTPWRCQQTLTRQLNLVHNRWEHMRRKVRLHSYPWILSVEPSNACNLRCPFCFTGAGGLGRPHASLSLELYRALLREIGCYVILLKAYGWGEPLLCGHLDAIIAEARAYGICTAVNTNLSFAFDDRRAEALVASGLDHLVVSIDGARQESYARYRVGGRLEQTLANMRRLNAAKARLGAESPQVSIEFHPFPWNVGDAPAVRDLADDVGAALHIFKGCMPGEDWDHTQQWGFCTDPKPQYPCAALWTTFVVAADGGVPPCNGTFYGADDMGHLDPDTFGAAGFHAVWNNERFQLARRFFHAREGTDVERQHVCFDCPATIGWERWRAHRAAGRDDNTFTCGFTTNDAWNYFWNRRPPNALRTHAERRA